MADDARPSFRTRRAVGAPPSDDARNPDRDPPDRPRKARDGDAHSSRLVFSGPGMSGTYLWHKGGYLPPLRFMEGDCLDCVVSGALKFGVGTLFSDDRAAPPADTPCELCGMDELEFRRSERFNLNWLAAASTEPGALRRDGRSRPMRRPPAG